MSGPTNGPASGSGSGSTSGPVPAPAELGVELDLRTSLFVTMVGDRRPVKDAVRTVIAGLSPALHKTMWVHLAWRVMQPMMQAATEHNRSCPKHGCSVTATSGTTGPDGTVHLGAQPGDKPATVLAGQFVAACANDHRDTAGDLWNVVEPTVRARAEFMSVVALSLARLLDTGASW